MRTSNSSLPLFILQNSDTKISWINQDSSSNSNHSNRGTQHSCKTNLVCRWISLQPVHRASSRALRANTSTSSRQIKILRSIRANPSTIGILRRVRASPSTIRILRRVNLCSKPYLRSTRHPPSPCHKVFLLPPCLMVFLPPCHKVFLPTRHRYPHQSNRCRHKWRSS